MDLEEDRISPAEHEARWWRAYDALGESACDGRTGPRGLSHPGRSGNVGSVNTLQDPKVAAAIERMYAEASDQMAQLRELDWQRLS